MLTVELVYDAGCPNAEAARLQLQDALALAGLPLEWQEWRRGAPESPVYVDGLGSPTILINGQDLVEPSPAGENFCRLYLDGTGRFQGVPTVEVITAALHRAMDAMVPNTEQMLIDGSQ